MFNDNIKNLLQVNYILKVHFCVFSDSNCVENKRANKVHVINDVVSKRKVFGRNDIVNFPLVI